MPTKLYLNDRNTILAVDTVDGDDCACMQTPLLSPMMSGRAVPEEMAEALLRRHGGRWVTLRGVKRFEAEPPTARSLAGCSR